MDKITSKIFIDGGEPEETSQANEILLAKLGCPLDGQTTNPTLIAKKLLSKIQISESKDTNKFQNPNDKIQIPKITEEEALNEYKRIVQEMSRIIPKGSVSIQVFANEETKVEDMLFQARERNKWIPNASIKLPCTAEGLKAAEIACKEMPINITLVFSQSQAAAVYGVTLQRKYPIFISPFVGRLDDKGENGMDVIKNIKEMYNPPAGGGDGHVELLTASVRSIEHILYAIYLKSEIITIPFKIFKLWADQNFPIPGENYSYKVPENLRPIKFSDDIKLGKNWQEYDLYHDLTSAGVEKFYEDWMGLYE